MSKPRREEDMQDMSSEGEEAAEDVEHVQSSEERPLSEQSLGEDLMDNQSEDYRRIEGLDEYQDEGVDNEDISYDYEAINKANQQIAKRHRMENIQKGDEMQDLIYEQEDGLSHEYHRRHFQHQDNLEDQQIDFDERRYLDAQECKGKLPEWIKQAQTIKFIHSKFHMLLTRFMDEQKRYAKYAIAIRDMVIKNQESIEVSYNDIKLNNTTIAYWVGLFPALILPQLNYVAYKIAVSNFPIYKTLKSEVYVKITELPFVDPIPDLRYTHLGKLVKIRGVITIRSEVLNQMKKVTYKCVRCGEPKGPYILNDKTEIKFTQCASCQSSGPFLIDKEKILFRNYQKLTVQQSPTEVLPGRIPRNKEILVYGDNVDVARPGDEVQVVGIYDTKYDSFLNAKQGFPLFSTMIEAVYIGKLNDNEKKQFDRYKAEEIKHLSKNPNIAQMIYGSIAPSIYGHQNVKRGLTLALFGGEAVEGVHRVRGDINVLLLGDPGIAKSQFLKSIQKVFYRTIYTTGKGASAVGLTASVKKDFTTNQWKLEAGALVLADKGVCLIDQFDKMNEHDRTSIHEAMEQQSISISKAGIVTSLRARCSVIAAANPRQGRYNSRLSFSDNIDLTGPILSRFDIMNVIKDQVNENLDRNLATFVINSHIYNHPYLKKYEFKHLQSLNDEKKDQRKPYIDIGILREYIRYARDMCHPHLSPKNHDIIKTFFNQLRQASKKYGGMHVSVRQVESIIRIATAHAKLHLRNQVDRKDVQVGIKVMLESFIQTQKSATAKNIEKEFKKYLSDDY